MLKCIRKTLASQIERLRKRFAQVEELPLGEVLSSAGLEQALDEEVGAYRERVFPPLETLRVFIRQVLDADQSCRQALERVVAEQVAAGEPPCSADTGAYCKARQRLPEALVQRLLRETGQALHEQAEAGWLWRGRAVKLVDGTTLSMPDTPANQAAYPQPSSQAAGVGFPLVRLVGLISLASGSVLDTALGPYQGKGSGEAALLRGLLGRIEAGDILLGDAYFGSYWLLAALQECGADGVFELHGRRPPGLGPGIKDCQPVWHKPKQRPEWLDEAGYRAMPETLTVRLLKAKGKVLVTTLRDAKAYPRQALAALYGRRWVVEVDLRSIKQGMQMGILRGKSPAMVRKEIAVHLLAYNLIRTVMAQAAHHHGLDPRTLSFTGTVQLLRAVYDQPLEQSEALLSIYHHLFKAISRHRVGNRPGRCEPRAVKRRPKSYPFLTKPRQTARNELFQQAVYA